MSNNITLYVHVVKILIRLFFEDTSIILKKEEVFIPLLYLALAVWGHEQYRKDIQGGPKKTIPKICLIYIIN